MTSTRILPALLLVDIQEGFTDPSWGSRNNPDAELGAARLLTAWRQAGAPVLHVQHRSRHADSPLHPDAPGYPIQACVAPLGDEAVFTKEVNSAFIGTGLEEHLKTRGIRDVVVVGLTTDHCVSTTTRMAANLGFHATVVSDATATFDRVGPDGRHWSAQDIHDTALASLHGEFARVLTVDEVREALAHP